MITIRLYDHPFAGIAPVEYKAENLAAWLLDHYGPSLKHRLQIYCGPPSGETDITDDVNAILRSDHPVYTILQNPGIEPISWSAVFANMAIALATTVVMQLLFPPPEMPANVNRTQQSPNNALGSRDNQVRLMQRVEDIYGSVRSIPSLMMQTYTKYHEHLEYEYGYYCISRGYCAISDVKDGETLLSEIDGTSAAVYHPFTSPNDGSPILTIGDPIIDGVVTVRRAIEIDGITLLAPNQVQPTHGTEHEFARVGSRNRIVQLNPGPNFNTIAEPGDTLVVDAPPITSTTFAEALNQATVEAASQTITAPGSAALWVYVLPGDSITISGMTDPANNGTFIVDSVTSSVLTLDAGSGLVDEVSDAASFSITRDFSGTYTIHAVGDAYVDLTINTWPEGAAVGYANLTLPGKSNETDWVTLPDVNRTEIWVNLVAPNGMYSDINGSRGEMYVDVEFEIERLDSETLLPTGQVESFTQRLSGAVSDQRAVTVEHVTAWTGPARVRAARTSPFNFDFNGFIIDETKWTDLYAVTPVDNQHFGNKTTIHTVTRATIRATALRTRQLNCIAARMLPIFDGTNWSGAFGDDGALVSGTISGTDRMINIVAAIVQDKKIGARPLSDLDLSQVWSVQQALDTWSDHVGKFNYTFDSDTLSFEETIHIVANAVNCVPYRQNGRIRFALDMPRDAPTALFTHRNKKPNAETITRRFASDSEYDGVEFVYLDDISRQPETIVLPLDGSATKLKKFEIPGIADFTQAWYRANREYRKLLGQRLSIETDVTTDARMLLPFTRVAIVDNTKFSTYDGEIIGQDGLLLILSDDVSFLPIVSHSIILMKRNGTLQSIPCTEGPLTNSVVLNYAPDEAIVSQESPDGQRTIYSFAADGSRDAQAWSIQEIGASDGQYIKLTAVNYSDNYYEMDSETVPSRKSIINL